MAKVSVREADLTVGPRLRRRGSRLKLGWQSPFARGRAADVLYFCNILPVS